MSEAAPQSGPACGKDVGTPDNTHGAVVCRAFCLNACVPVMGQVAYDLSSLGPSAQLPSIAVRDKRVNSA